MTEDAPDKPPTLSQQFLSATAWNAVLLPARFLVGMVSTVVYYQVLKREEVGLVFFLTSLATTIGLYADLGIERSLPRFLPEVERDYGRQGVVRLLGQVVLVKIAILLVLIGAPRRVLGTPHAHPGRAAAPGCRSHRGPHQPRRGDGGLGGHAPTARRLGPRRGPDRGQLRAVAPGCSGRPAPPRAPSSTWGCSSWPPTSSRRPGTSSPSSTTLLQPILVTAFVLAGAGIRGVLIGLVLTPLVSLSLAAVQVRRAARGLSASGEDRPIAREVWRRLVGFAGMNYLTQVTTWLYDIEAVVFFSAALLGFSEVAILGFAYKFAKDALGYIWTPLTGVMTPAALPDQGPRQHGRAPRRPGEPEPAHPPARRSRRRRSRGAHAAPHRHPLSQVRGRRSPHPRLHRVLLRGVGAERRPQHAHGLRHVSARDRVPAGSPA